MCFSEELTIFKGIGQLAKEMVDIMKNGIVHPLVYSLITLSMILLVATIIVERTFLAMNIIKNRLHN